MLKNELEKELASLNNDDGIDPEDIAQLTEKLEGENKLSFFIRTRTTDSDYWFEAETSATIRKDTTPVFMGIVFDWDALSKNRRYSLNEAAEALIELEKNAHDIISFINRGIVRRAKPTICVPVYYYINGQGKKIYDKETIRDEFESRLQKYF